MPRMWGSSNKFAPRRKRQVVSDAGCVRTHRTFVRSLHKRRRSDTPCSGQLIAIAFCSIGVLVVTAVQNLNSHSRSVSLSASSANVNGKCARIHTDDTRVLLGLENFVISRIEQEILDARESACLPVLIMPTCRSLI